eukprot:5688272-Pleurochrysis_carterae.AAC.1
MTAARLFHSLLPHRVCLLLPQRSLPSLIHQGEIRCVSTTSHYQGVKTMCRASAPLSTFKSNHAFARPQWQHKQISEMCTLSSNRKSRPRKRRWGPSKPKQTKGPPKELDSFTTGMLGQKEGRVLFPAGHEIGGGYTVVEHIGRGAFGKHTTCAVCCLKFCHDSGHLPELSRQCSPCRVALFLAPCL